MANWQDIEARENVRKEYEQALQQRLEALGVQFRIAHFTGDSSYPTEYSLRYSFVQAVGPTFDLALTEFIEKLLKHVPVENALEQVAREEQEYEDTRKYIEHYYEGGDG